MTFSFNRSPDVITTAINSFNSAYHSDYFKVKELAGRYLNSPPAVETSLPLADALSSVLTNWGAGKRMAPICQPIAEITKRLSNIAFHRDLIALQRSANALEIREGRRELKSGASFGSVSEFDDCLIDTMSFISTAFFIGNTNVTYPMKSLLLITGLMPAFDSQVKGGLAVAGVTGVKKNRYLIPQKGSPDARKICAVPFYIADCISNTSNVINVAIAASDYPNLVGDTGRIFDVLLFEQNSLTPEAAIIKFASLPNQVPWWSI